jgi:hypothetical protein
VTSARIHRRHDRSLLKAEAAIVKALKVLLVSIGALLAALIVIPMVVLGGLFVWLKLTEESDEEAMELDDTI